MNIMSSKLRIGYVPYSTSFTHPGDHGRFAGYASARGLSFEVARWEERYDLIVLTEWADISMWRHYPHGKIVYDLIDSYLAIPKTNVKGCLRGIAKYVSRQSRQLQLNYWEAIRDMCRRSDAVVCTTEAQRSYILPFCKNVHVVLDAHYAVRDEVKRDYKANVPFKLVWVGLPSNITQLGVVRSVLQDLGRRYQIELRVVTALDGFRFLSRFWRVSSARVAKRIFDQAKVLAWNEDTAAKYITECDIAIIPIDCGDSLSAGKPENKLIFLWRMGMPVVASATLAYSYAMKEAGQSLTCKDDAEWVTTLEKLILEEAARRDAGERGKQYALRCCSDAQIHNQWDTIFRSVGFDFR